MIWTACSGIWSRIDKREASLAEVDYDEETGQYVFGIADSTGGLEFFNADGTPRTDEGTLSPVDPNGAGVPSEPATLVVPVGSALAAQALNGQPTYGTAYISISNPDLASASLPSAESQVAADEAAAGVQPSDAAAAFSIYGTDLNYAEAAGSALTEALNTAPAQLDVDPALVPSLTSSLDDFGSAQRSTYDNVVSVVTDPSQQYNFFSTIISEVQAATDSILNVAGIALANSRDVLNSVIEELVAPAATKFISSVGGIALQVEIGVASDPNVGLGCKRSIRYIKIQVRALTKAPTGNCRHWSSKSNDNSNVSR
jgi:hypothetical protein